MRRSGSIAIAVLVVVCSFAWMVGSRSQEVIGPKGNNNVNKPKDISPDKEKSPESERAKDRARKNKPQASPSP